MELDWNIMFEVQCLYHEAQGEGQLHECLSWQTEHIQVGRKPENNQSYRSSSLKLNYIIYLSGVGTLITCKED